MSTVDTSQLHEVIDSFRESTQIALSNECAADFDHLERELGEIDGYVRELQQAMWADEAEEALKRLEDNETLSPTDKDVIRTFLVSDAEHYLATENSYADWVSELQRLMDDLRRRCTNVDRDNIGELRGVIKDAVRLLPDIRNYLEEHARVERFDLAVDSIDDKTRQMLVRIIREQLYSPAR